jgi:serine acetyltransferase
MGAGPSKPPEWAHGLELTVPPMGFAKLVWSDYLAERLDRREPSWLLALLYLPRLLVNPSLQFALLVRLVQKGPRFLQHPVRWLQVVVFSSEIYWFKREGEIQIGPGVVFPHPMNVIIGAGTRIGSGVAIYNNTNIGADRHFGAGARPWERAVQIGDRAVVYAYSALQGPFVVGHDAVVGLHVVLDEDVPPGALKTHRHLRNAGEWPGEQRAAWGQPPSA